MKKTAPFGEKFVITAVKDGAKIEVGTSPAIAQTLLVVESLYEAGYQEVIIKDESIYVDESYAEEELLYSIYKEMRLYIETRPSVDMSLPACILASTIHKINSKYSNFSDRYTADKKTYSCVDDAIGVELKKNETKEYIHLKPVGGFCCS